MTYQTLTDVNTSAGLHTLLVYVNDVTSGMFIRLMLFAIFLIIAIASFLSQQRTTGRGNLPASFAIAGYITAGAAIILSLINGLVNVFDLAIVIGVSIVSTLWLFLARSSD